MFVVIYADISKFKLMRITIKNNKKVSLLQIMRQCTTFFFKLI